MSLIAMLTAAADSVWGLAYPAGLKSAVETMMKRVFGGKTKVPTGNEGPNIVEPAKVAPEKLPRWARMVNRYFERGLWEGLAEWGPLFVDDGLVDALPKNTAAQIINRIGVGLLSAEQGGSMTEALKYFNDAERRCLDAEYRPSILANQASAKIRMKDKEGARRSLIAAEAACEDGGKREYVIYNWICLANLEADEFAGVRHAKELVRQYPQYADPESDARRRLYNDKDLAWIRAQPSFEKALSSQPVAVSQGMGGPGVKAGLIGAALLVAGAVVGLTCAKHYIDSSTLLSLIAVATSG